MVKRKPKVAPVKAREALNVQMGAWDAASRAKMVYSMTHHLYSEPKFDPVEYDRVGKAAYVAFVERHGG